jgi:hypothetical protein
MCSSDPLRDPTAQRVPRDGKALRCNGQHVLGHLDPRGLGVQNQDLARRDVGKVLDRVLEQPFAAADAGNEGDVLARLEGIYLTGQPPTQNDDVVDPCDWLSVGSAGLPLDGLDTDPFPLACI